MPRLPGWALLLLAIVFAILATYLALGYLKRQAVVQPPVKKKISVVRAREKVQKEEILSATQLKIVEWDQEKPPKDFFDTVKAVEGRKTAESLEPNDIITTENTKRIIPGMAGQVSPNQRAMTVKVDEASGVAGFLTPGNRVDVVVVMDKGEFDKNPIAKTLFQNLKVLGTGQKTVTSPEDKPQIVPTVTLEVTPEQGELLALAAVEGRISLVLRGQLPVETLPPVPKRTVPGTSALLSPNQRAITVKVDEASGVAGFLALGDRVDVVVVMDKEEWKKYPLAKILFQDIKVLGTDQRKQTVTLAVTPQEGVDLAWAAQVGRISLVLSGSGDKTDDKNKEKVKTLRADAGRFFGQSNPPPARRMVQLIRGIEWTPEEPLDNK